MVTQQKIILFVAWGLTCSSAFGAQATEEASLHYIVPSLLHNLPPADETRNSRFAMEYRPILALSHQRASNAANSGLSLFSTTLGWESAPDIQYATFRTEGSFYWKGKAGYTWDEQRSDWGDFKNIFSKFDVNGAIGLGAGYQLNNGQRFEIEYTTRMQDSSLLNLGLTF